MKILFLQDDYPPYAKGGAGVIAESFACSLAQLGHEVTVITCVQDRSRVSSLVQDNVHIERIYSEYAERWRSWRSLYNPATLPKIRRILKQVKPDIVHAHNVHYHLSYWALYLARRSGARVFLTAHDAMLFDYGKLISVFEKNNSEHPNYEVSALQQVKTYRFWYNPLRNLIIRRILKNVSRIFAVSAALKDALTQNGITNVEVLYNGIDVKKWDSISPASLETFLHRHGLEGKKIVLMGGRLSALKGGDAALAMMRKLVRREPEAVLLLLGKSSAYTEKLLTQARKWNIAQHVVCAGWLSGNELLAAYHLAKVVVVPSLYLDPLPTITLEAMACRAPVIGSYFGGIPEMVIDEETGYVVDPRNTDQFVLKIGKVLSDTVTAKRLGNAGRERVCNTFNLENQTNLLLTRYEVFR